MTFCLTPYRPVQVHIYKGQPFYGSNDFLSDTLQTSVRMFLRM